MEAGVGWKLGRWKLGWKLEAGVEAGVVVGQASSSNMTHSNRNMNVAIASERSSGSIARQRQEDLAA